MMGVATNLKSKKNVLKKEYLATSLKILEEAIKVYPGSKVKQAIEAIEE
jgi:hypothetical protein